MFLRRYYRRQNGKRQAYWALVEAYRTVMPESAPARAREILDARPDCITFTSSSTVRNFVAVLIDKRRIKLLSEIVAKFAQELNQRLGFADAEITTARDLSKEERSELEGDLEGEGP